MNRIFKVQRHGSAAKGCMISALIAFTLLLVGAGVGTYLVIKNGRGWAASVAEQGMIAMVDESHMPTTEKGEVKVILGRLREDFENKIITLEDFANIVKEFTESPLIPATIATESYEMYYNKNADLSEEDKASARLALSRVSRGVFEESMTTGELVDVLEPINAEIGSASTGVTFQLKGTNIKLKAPDDCTIEELRQVIVNAEAAADEAGVPDEMYSIDISEEFQNVIDRALASNGAEEESLVMPEPVEDTETDVEEAAEEAVEEAGGGTAEDDTDDGP